MPQDRVIFDIKVQLYRCAGVKKTVAFLYSSFARHLLVSGILKMAWQPALFVLLRGLTYRYNPYLKTRYSTLDKSGNRYPLQKVCLG